jgi:hypothetical protein
MRVMKILFIFLTALVLTNAIPEAEEIRPGVVINKENYDKYRDSLKNLMPPGVFEDIFDKGIKEGLLVMPVVKKRQYSPPKGFVKWTKKNEGICKIGAGNKLLNWKAGSPFPNPKNATELAWDVRLWCEPENDQFRFLQHDQYLFQGFKKERRVGFYGQTRSYMGRTMIPPIPEEPKNSEGIWRRAGTVFIYPFDVKPFAILQTQYWDLYKDNDTLAYIPALRRVRRFTGADTQDPLVGTDIIVDDYACWFQKISPQMTFKNLGVKNFLVPVRWETQKIRKVNPFVAPEEGMKWEIRPLYVLEVNINDPTYVYSKRVLYVDKEDGYFTIHYGLFYDQRGRLFRSWSNSFFRDPVTHYIMFATSIVHDHLSGHSTVPTITAIPNDPDMTAGKFTIRWLIKRGH